MAEVRIAATAHSPGMTGFPERAEPAAAERALAAIAELRRRIEQRPPDVVVGVSNDHFTTTSMASLAPFSIATAHRFANPATPKLAEFLGLRAQTTPANPELAHVLLRALLDADVDVAQLGGPFGFDENFAVPLHLLGLTHTPLVPFVVNAVQAPMPSLGRCRAVGERLGAILRSQAVAGSVLVLATGGLSHSVGTASAGRIDERFDRWFLENLSAGRLDSLTGLDEVQVSAAGNGTEEIRQWIVAASAVSPEPVEVIDYVPVHGWLTGIAVAGSPTAP